MREQEREMRRMAGMIANSLGKLRLEEVSDTRKTCQIKYPLPVLLAAIVLGLANNMKSLKDVEEQTEFLSNSLRTKLNIPKRISDSTMRYSIMRISPDEIRRLLHKQVKSANRSKQLNTSILPIGVCSIDGKYSVTKKPDENWAQKRNGKHQLRTMSCSLVSSEIPMVLDTIPVPEETNEMGIFKYVIHSLNKTYGKSQLIQVVSCDAGMCSLDNANEVIKFGFDYLFALKNDQPTLLGEAEWLIGPKSNLAKLASTRDVLNSKTTELREIWVCSNYNRPLIWEHLKTFIRVKRTLIKNGKIIIEEDRYFCSSMKISKLTSIQWLKLIRSHWRVENNIHNILDKFYREDEQPWLYSTQGQLIITLLRRVVLNMMLVYKYLRRIKHGNSKKMTWRRLIHIIKALIYGANDGHLSGLRWTELARSLKGGKPG